MSRSYSNRSKTISRESLKKHRYKPKISDNHDDDEKWRCVECKLLNGDSRKVCFNCRNRRPKNDDLVKEVIDQHGKKVGELVDENGHKILGRGQYRGFSWLKKLNPDTGKVYKQNDLTGREIISNKGNEIRELCQKKGWECINPSCISPNLDWRMTCYKCGSFKPANPKTPVFRKNFMPNNKTH